jgi:hypothetical protein
MSLLEMAYAAGQLAALTRRPKLGWLSTTHPVVQQSGLLKSQPTPAAPTIPTPPSTPETLRETFDRHEQGETRVEPRRKLSTESICTSCRKARHYGHCSRPIAIKKSDFNVGLTSDDAADHPSTSPNYHSATVADSAPSRTRDGRPADEQAASAFADLYRHLGITSLADEPGPGGAKIAFTPIEAGIASGIAPMAITGLADQSDMRGMLGAGLGGALGGTLLGTLANTATRQRFPGAGLSLMGLGGQLAGTAVGGMLGHHAAHKLSQFKIRKAGELVAPTASSAVTRAFGQIDAGADSTCIEGASAPPPGPAA